MNIEYLRNFVIIVESGNILTASKKLFIAQPSLSNQIKYLEDEYQTQLIKRGKSLQLTESGKLLYEKAKIIINTFDSTYIEINNIKHGNLGHIDIAIPPTVYNDLINKNFNSFINNYPNIKLNVYELNSKEALKKLKEGGVELAITNAFIEKSEDFDYVDLGLETYQVFIFEDNKLKGKSSLTIEDLSNERIVIPRAYINDIKTMCDNQNVNINLIATTTSSMGAIEMARLQKALAIVPLPQNEKVIEALDMVPLIYSSNLQYSRKLVFNKNKELTTASKLFIECLTSFKK